MRRAAWRSSPIGPKSRASAAWIYASAALSLLVCSPSTAEDLAAGSQLDSSHLAYTRLYCTPDNESHFGGVEVGLRQAELRAARRLDLHWRKSTRFKHVFRRIRGPLGSGRSGEPPLPSDPCGSVACRGAGAILDHNNGRGDQAATYRRCCPARGCRALQRSHHRRGRHDRFPPFRSPVVRFARTKTASQLKDAFFV